MTREVGWVRGASVSRQVHHVLKSSLLAVALVVVATAGPLNGWVITAHTEVVNSTPGLFVPLAVTSYQVDYNHRWTWYEWPDVLNQDPQLDVWQVDGLASPGQTQPGPDPSPTYGIISFNVLTTGPVLLAVTNRWGGGGNSSGNWIPELTTKESFLADGWVEYAGAIDVWDEALGIPTSSWDSPFYYTVYKRDSQAGEQFTYRTEKYNPPALLTTQTEPAPVYALTEVVDSAPRQLVPLEIGSNWFSDGDRWTWASFPDYLNEDGQPYIYQTPTGPSYDWATLSFNVLTDGLVLLAATNRGWPDRESPYVTKESFLADGWVQLPGVMDLNDHTTDPVHHGLTSQYPPGEEFYYEIFSRQCVAGESFTYQNESYHAPALIQISAVKPGDVNGDGILSVDDLDQLTRAVRQHLTASVYDINNNGRVDGFDRLAWLTDIKQTVFGDADLDGVFDSNDMVQVFVAGEYEDGIPGNSTWAEGDFGGDGEFDSDDMVLAFQTGAYEKGKSASAVPEPGSWLLSLFALVAIAHRTKSSTVQSL